MQPISTDSIKSLAARISAELLFTKKRVYLYVRGRNLYFSLKNYSDEKLIISAHPSETETEIHRKLNQNLDRMVNGSRIKSSLEKCLVVMRAYE